MSSEWFYFKDIIRLDSIENASELHHIRHVLRKKAGENITAVNGQGEVAIVRIKSLEKKTIAFELIEKHQVVRSDIDFVFCPALPHHDATMEDMLRSAIQLGITKVKPVISARSKAVRAAQFDAKLDRWRKIVINACKQCRQSWFPEIARPMDLAQMLTEIDSEKWMILAGFEPRHLDSSNGLYGLFREIKPRRICWLCGPEGGWTDGEVQLFQNHQVQALTLGHLVLTTQTAGTSGLAVIRFMLDQIR